MTASFWCYLYFFFNTYLCYSCAGASFRIRGVEFLLQESNQALEATVSIGGRLALFPATDTDMFQAASCSLSTLPDSSLRVGRVV